MFPTSSAGGASLPATARGYFLPTQTADMAGLLSLYDQFTVTPDTAGSDRGRLVAAT